MFSILVVEDDKNLRKLMLAVLKQNGYIGLSAENGEEALEIMDTSHVDLIISDIMMPYMDGYELADILREANYHLPILMVTAKESFEDKKKGFLIGIDDYMVKPVDMDEMILRINALLRRSHIINKHLITIKDVVLDYNNLTVTKNKESILLPKKEFYLLFKLLNYPKRIFTRQELMDEIWGMDAETDERTVDVHIKRLREKFFHFEEFEIITVRGLGYKAEKYDDKT
jgi:DNA-binding response OmpR family regulator